MDSPVTTHGATSTTVGKMSFLSYSPLGLRSATRFGGLVNGHGLSGDRSGRGRQNP